MTAALCSVPECGRPRRTLDLCPAHYLRKLRGKPLSEPVRRRRPKGADRGPCSVSGCYRPAYGNQGICVGHYRRKETMGKADWAKPLKLYRKRNTTRDVTARVSRDVAAAIDRQAKARGYDRGEWIRIILEAHVGAGVLP